MHTRLWLAALLLIAIAVLQRRRRPASLWLYAALLLGTIVWALAEVGLHVRLDITETASTVATTVLLEASDMLAIMPASLAAHYARLGVLQVVPVELPLQVPPIHLVMRRQRELSPAALGFLEVLRARAGESGHRVGQGDSRHPRAGGGPEQGGSPEFPPSRE